METSFKSILESYADHPQNAYNDWAKNDRNGFGSDNVVTVSEAMSSLLESDLYKVCSEIRNKVHQLEQQTAKLRELAARAKKGEKVKRPQNKVIAFDNEISQLCKIIDSL